MSKILVIDTSILCVWLKVPGMGTCGPDHDRWDYSRVNGKIEEEEREKATFVLPLATIIETGNHISQSSGMRKECADALAHLMAKAAEQQSPWAAFADQSTLWTPENLKAVAEYWPALAAQRLSLGDATIKDVAEYYAQIGYSVEILTGDQGLKAYEPERRPRIPRRNRYRQR